MIREYAYHIICYYMHVPEFSFKFQHRPRNDDDEEANNVH